MVEASKSKRMESVPVRLGATDLERADRLAERAGLGRSTLVRLAMRAGLAVLERDPGALLGGGDAHATVTPPARPTRRGA